MLLQRDPLEDALHGKSLLWPPVLLPFALGFRMMLYSASLQNNLVNQKLTNLMDAATSL